jgi:sulfatase maturation enzyme AslB (radical SAM superfamily)
MIDKSLYTLYATEFKDDNQSPRIIPPTVEIDLTNSCNQDCIYCCSAVHRKVNPSRAKYDHFIKLIDDLADWNLRNSKGGLTSLIFVGGGEPTLFKEYEEIIKYSIDKGFMISIVTNGTKLDKLLKIGSEYIKKIQWIGVDIDSADIDIFNSVRLPKTKNQFEIIKENIQLIVNAGGTVDIKALILDETANKENITKLFQYTQDVNARMLYIRSAVMENGDGNAFIIEDMLINHIHEMGKVYNVTYRAKQRDSMANRCYKKCYALYLLPIFCADGLIYLCPEHRGNKDLTIGNWITDDWKKIWCGESHSEIFNKFDISICPACRPDPYNTGIQSVLNNPISFEELFL